MHDLLPHINFSYNNSLQFRGFSQLYAPLLRIIVNTFSGTTNMLYVYSTPGRKIRTYAESLSFSFFRIPKAFLVRFFNPEEKEEQKGELLHEETSKA